MGEEVSSGLAWWAGPGQDLWTALPRIAQEPRLPAAVAALAGAMLEVTGADPDLDQLCKDAGLYAGAMGAFLLHETDGLTPPRLKALGARTGMLSPGRARSLLQLLEHLRYAEPAGYEGRAIRYALTDRFRAAWVIHLRAALTAARTLEPEIDTLLAAPGDAAILAFGRIHAGILLQTTAAASDVRASLPVLDVFMHAYAGSHILWALLTTSHGGAFPPVTAGPVSGAGLARRFGVSRIHVRRILNQGVAAGLIAEQPGGCVHFSPEAQEQLRYVWAIQHSHILMAAALTVAELARA